VYSALGSFYIPMLVMLFFYWRIYRAAIRTTRAINQGFRTTKGKRRTTTSEPFASYTNAFLSSWYIIMHPQAYSRAILVSPVCTARISISFCLLSFLMMMMSYHD
jgi:hypothetical protein